MNDLSLAQIVAQIEACHRDRFDRFLRLAVEDNILVLSNPPITMWAFPPRFHNDLILWVPVGVELCGDCLDWGEDVNVFAEIDVWLGPEVER